MEILVFGGSFDPPHLGHAALLREGLMRVRPDLAYVFPAFRSPFKPGTRTPGKERLALARLTLAGPRVRVHPFELSRGRAVYTYETLRFLKKRHPGARLTFLAGSDALAALGSWRRASELRRACGWLSGRRPGGGPAPKGVETLPGTFPDISSTELRCGLLAGLDVSKRLAPGALARIKARGLYGLAHHQRLARELSPRRYAHSVAVARRSLELARRHALDAERAALAGLLHDCGRALSVPAMARHALSRRLKAPRLRDLARRAPLLLHAYVGEDLARRRYGVSDPAVLSAVRKHTLGDLRMSMLDRLVYAADACSADRDYPEAALIHRAALRGVDQGFRLALRVKLDHALRRGAWIHPLGVEVWNRAIEEQG